MTTKKVVRSSSKMQHIKEEKSYVSTQSGYTTRQHDEEERFSLMSCSPSQMKISEKLNEILEAPKTDYTYSRTETYSLRFRRKPYVTPNMSRRGLRDESSDVSSYRSFDAEGADFAESEFNYYGKNHEEIDNSINRAIQERMPIKTSDISYIRRVVTHFFSFWAWLITTVVTTLVTTWLTRQRLLYSSVRSKFHSAFYVLSRWVTRSASQRDTQLSSLSSSRSSLLSDTHSASDLSSHLSSVSTSRSASRSMSRSASRLASHLASLSASRASALTDTRSTSRSSSRPKSVTFADVDTDTDSDLASHTASHSASHSAFHSISHSAFVRRTAKATRALCCCILWLVLLGLLLTGLIMVLPYLRESAKVATTQVRLLFRQNRVSEDVSSLVNANSNETANELFIQILTKLTQLEQQKLDRESVQSMLQSFLADHLKQQVDPSSVDALRAELQTLKANLNQQKNTGEEIRSLQIRVNSIEAQLKKLEEIGSQTSNLKVELENLKLDMEKSFQSVRQEIDLSTSDLRQQVKLALSGYLEKENLTDAKYEDLRRYIEQHFVTQRSLESELHFVRGEMNTIRRTGSNGSQGVHSSGSCSCDDEKIWKIVHDALNLYSADKIGMVDFALESGGGSVVGVRCTETYNTRSAQISLFGIPLWYVSNSPRTVIQPETLPGQCWAFKGSEGHLVIQLAAWVIPSSFTLEHIPKSLSATGKVDSAPKEFEVLGLQNEQDYDGVLLGRFVYDENGPPLQSFPVQATNNNASFHFVELRINSNHGNEDYTCLYRFRVHGKLDRL